MRYLQNLTVSPPKHSSINNVVLIYVENLTNSQQFLYPPRRWNRKGTAVTLGEDTCRLILNQGAKLTSQSQVMFVSRTLIGCEGRDTSPPRSSSQNPYPNWIMRKDQTNSNWVSTTHLMSSKVWQSQKPKGRQNCPRLKVTKETWRQHARWHSVPKGTEREH